MRPREHVGMSWYTPESWQRMREIADNRDEWPDTFGAFVKKTERLILQFEREGIVVEKQVIDVDDCVRWCRRNGYRIDNAGRACLWRCTSVFSAGRPGGGYEEMMASPEFVGGRIKACRVAAGPPAN